MAAATLVAIVTAQPAVAQNPIADYVKTLLFSVPITGVDPFQPVAGPNNISDSGTWLGAAGFGDPATGTNIAVAVRTPGSTATTYPFGVTQYTMPVEINRNGVVLAYRLEPGTPNYRTVTLVWDGIHPVVEMPGRIPLAINGRGDILTMLAPTGSEPTRAFLLDGVTGVEVELASLTSTYQHFGLHDLNDNGDVLGVVYEPNPVFGGYRPSCLC